MKSYVIGVLSGLLVAIAAMAFAEHGSFATAAAVDRLTAVLAKKCQ